MAEKKKPSVTFEYIKSHDYKVHHVHGGIGGPNGYGELILNLYFERGPIPRKVTHKIYEDGRLDEKPIDMEIKNSVIRDVYFGLSLNIEHAKSLGKWLIDNAEQLEKQFTKK